jgi:hypothetical protein
MSIQWPDSLIPEVAERRCIVVLGAGASAACTAIDGADRHPPNWSTLLNDALGLLSDPSDRSIAASLIAKDRFLDAAEMVVARANPADLAAFVRSILVEPHFAHSRIHEEIYRLDTKIVVTTNYDDIYETYCKQGKGSQAFNVCRYYESHALNDVRSTMRLILKAHGCVSNPQKAVLSRTQYHRARRDYPEYFNLLDALFVSNTLLFVGCSLVDPDFQLLLEGANIKCPSDHPHYAVLEGGQAEPLRSAIRTVFNVQCLEYTAGVHNEVVDGLVALNDRVAEWRRTHP